MRERVEKRRLRVPTITYPGDLPVAARKDEIARLIDAHQVVIVCGETGSGKTTQLPKICLELGRGLKGTIGHTQPRRVAARSVAARIATETKTELGWTVGYKIRFSERGDPETPVRVMTDGILLAEIQRDKLLKKYDTLIIDEAHERSLNIDFLLGYVKRILPKRPDLKLVITSATIDTEKFSRHFGDAPVIEVSGRAWPVEVRYAVTEDADRDDGKQLRAIVEETGRLLREPVRKKAGDILVFLAGEREIRETAEALGKQFGERLDVLPLFARLSAKEQDRVFKPGAKRRVVLATNVAETSITVPRIGFVIDPGTARISRYSYRGKVQRLPIEKISRASANQRKGRCGRLAPGVCVRLYTEEDFDERPEYTAPEIQRTNLASVILRMEDIGLGDVSRFPFVDAPDARFVKDGYRLLRELEAVDTKNRITSLGRRVARFPVDPRFGRMIMAGADAGCLTEVIVIVSGLSIQDPRERPLEKTTAADEAHARFHHEKSDFLALKNIWDGFHKTARESTGSALRKWCRQSFLNYLRMREWQDVHRQLTRQARETGLAINDRPAAEKAVHTTLLTGLLGHIGYRDEEKSYLGPRNRRFLVFPGSGLAAKPPRWLVAAALVETTRLYARTVAAVRPEWIESVADHLVRRDYLEPEWDPRSGRVIAYERVTLFGLTLCARRRVNYDTVDRPAARSIFIDEALVSDRLNADVGFLEANRTVVEEAERLEAMIRKRELMVDHRWLTRFYDERLPARVASRKTLRSWLRGAEKKDPDVLRICLGDLLRDDARLPEPSEFPSELTVAGNRLGLSYRFEPGDDADGITLSVPQPLLGQLKTETVDRLVPGRLEEKIAALVRALPKPLRRQFVPVPDTARRIHGEMNRDADLRKELARLLTREAGTVITPDVWSDTKLPDDLEMRISVTDENGNELGAGRDLDDLKDRFATAGAVSVPASADTWSRTGVTAWDFGDIPETVTVKDEGLTLRLYPALEDKVDSVSLSLFETPARAAAATRGGLLRLFMLVLNSQCKYLRKELHKNKSLLLLAGSHGSGDTIADDLTGATFERCFLFPEMTKPNRADFERRCAENRAELMNVGERLSATVERILQRRHELAVRLDAFAGGYREEVGDILCSWLETLVPPDFVRKTSPEWLEHYPRYLEAASVRIGKLVGGDSRDRSLEDQVAPHWERLIEACPDLSFAHGGELERYRYMVEEFRVSLFAQPLGTAVPVSAKRLDTQWDKAAGEISQLS